MGFNSAFKGLRLLCSRNQTQVL